MRLACKYVCKNTKIYVNMINFGLWWALFNNLTVSNLLLSYFYPFMSDFCYS